MRLSDIQVEAIFESMKLPEDGRALVREIRAGQPARRVSRAANITGTFTSAKMGLTIQYESRGEAIACATYEGAPGVSEFYEQPRRFTDIPYRPLGTDVTTIEHTPDFFVIRQAEIDGDSSYEIVFEEWKQRATLEHLSAGDPKRWLSLLGGGWTQLPVEEYLRTLGLGYRVRVIDEAPPLLLRNIDLLSDYHLHPRLLDGALLAAVREVVGTTPGISLAALRRDVTGLTVDDVFGAIAGAQLFTNLEGRLLTDHDNVRLFLDPVIQGLFTGGPKPVDRGELILAPGARLRWGERAAEVLNVTENHVYLGGEAGEQKISRATFEQWVEDGDICGVSDGRQSLAETLLAHGPAALRRAQERLQVITPFLNGEAFPEDRSHQRWLASYRRAAELHGDGIAGLLADNAEKGNREARLTEETEVKAAAAIRTYLLGPDQIAVRKAHAFFTRDCADAGIPGMALSSFHARYRVLSQAERLRARVGRKAANGAAMPSRGSLVPAQGDYAMSRVPIDHTTGDLELVDSVTGANLGRPEITLAVDAYSRKILVALALFQKPGGSTDLLAVRELIRRHHRWPSTIQVDGGSDFDSQSFTDVCEAYHVKIEHRRTGNPRDGALVEAAFKKLNTDLLWVMRGNTQIRKNVRAMGPEHDPSKRAVWTLSALQEELDRYVDFHNAQPIASLGGSPNEIYDRSLALAGARTFRFQAYSPAFRALTAATPRSGGTAKVGREGVQIHNLTYFCLALQLPGLDGTEVPVRYEPLDARIAYVQVKGVWHVAEAKFRELEGRTEKEVAVASQELRRRLGKAPSTYELATHLKKVHEHQDQLTTDQGRRSRKREEQRAVVVGREPALSEPHVEVEVESMIVPVAQPASELELEGYEAHTEEELQQMLADIRDEKEAA
jgi:transposase InsO family protein